MAAEFKVGQSVNLKWGTKGKKIAAKVTAVHPNNVHLSADFEGRKGVVIKRKKTILEKLAK